MKVFHFLILQKTVFSLSVRRVEGTTLMEAEDKLLATLDEDTLSIVAHIEEQDMLDINEIAIEETLAFHYTGIVRPNAKVLLYQTSPEVEVTTWRVKMVTLGGVYLKRDGDTPNAGSLKVPHNSLYVLKDVVSTPTFTKQSLPFEVMPDMEDHVQDTDDKTQLDRLSMVIEKQQDTINALLGIL